MKLVRDEKNKAVLVKDSDGLKEYRTSRSKRRDKDKKINNLEERLQKIEKYLESLQ